MANVVQQDGDLNGQSFLIADLGSFGAQHVDGLGHQVKGTQGVVKTRVQCPRVNIVRQTDLFDAPQALKIGVLNEIENDAIRHRDESINGVIEDFVGSHTLNLMQILKTLFN